MICKKYHTAFLCEADKTFLCSDQKCGHPELTPLSLEPEFPSYWNPKSSHDSRLNNSELTWPDEVQHLSSF